MSRFRSLLTELADDIFRTPYPCSEYLLAIVATRLISYITLYRYAFVQGIPVMAMGFVFQPVCSSWGLNPQGFYSQTCSLG